MGARDRIRKLLLENVGQPVPRDSIREAANISGWARRVRELREDEGYDIKAIRGGYILRSSVPTPPDDSRRRLSLKAKYRIFHRDHSRCRRCGRTPEHGVTLVVDHIVPLDWGGTNDDANLWTLCHECNAGKKAWQSDADAQAMRAILDIKGARNRLREYFRFKSGQVCTREELQIVSGIAQYARRIRELRAEGMKIRPVGSRGDYVYETSDEP